MPRTSSLIRLGNLLPTLPRKYFTSHAELPFHHGGDLHLATAWWCAEASMLAYQDPANVAALATHALGQGWQLHLFGAEEPTFAVLLISDCAAILAFRGTRVGGFETLDRIFTQPWMNYADLKTDTNFLLAPFHPQGKVHRGILAAFESFWAKHGADVSARVGRLPVFLTGHSLGGALATVTAASLRLPSVRALYSFGSPRVGDTVFRHHLMELGVPVHRFAHGLDLVTTIAPQNLLGYSHVGDILHLASKGRTIDTEEPDLARVLLNAFQLFLPTVRSTILNLRQSWLAKPTRLLVPRSALADHAPIFYVEKIRSLALSESRGA